MQKEYLTKIEILNEATPLFDERGYNAVTVREVAAASGITESAVCRHFEWI